MSTTPTDRGTLLARRLRLDVDTATYPASTYQQVPAIYSINPIIEPRAVDDEIDEDDGAPREAVTGAAWRVEIKIRHSRNGAGTAIDTIHRFMRTMFNASSLGSNVTAGEFGVRWYDRNGLDDAESYEGRVYVKSWTRDGQTSADTEGLTLVLQGQGPLTPITNPAGSLIPVVSGLSTHSAGTAGGGLVQISGTHFTGATAVKFGTTDATAYTVVDDARIVAQIPAHTAGTVQVKVTTAAGSSADVAADDMTYA